MEEAIQKFSKYSVHVEHDLESLIFSMLNLIDTKTRTLKKLLKLHLQIRTIRREAHSKYKKHVKTNEIIPNGDFLLTDSVDDLTFSEDSQGNNQNEINELKGISESFALSPNSSVTGIGKEKFETDGQLDEKIDEVNDFANNIEQSDSENVPNVGDDETHFKDLHINLTDLSKEPRETSERSKVRVFPANRYDLKDCTTSMHSLIMENLTITSSTKSTQSEAVSTKEVKTVVYPNFCKKRENQTNENNACIQSSVSSTSSYCVVAHLQGVLNTLQDCLPGDSGVYIENTSYKDVLNTLEKLLMSCGISFHSDELNRSKAIGMNKCNTQPTLKTTYEEVPRRMISSSTDCNKIFKKKMRI